MKKLLGGLKRVAGLLLPMFARAKDVRSMGPAVRWTIHLVLLAAVLIGVAILFRANGLRNLIPPGWWGPIRPLVPSLLLLSLYLLCWVGWWIYVILMEPPPASRFPDIDEAWDEALRALDGAGIALAEAPLFLVVGRPAAGLEGLFEASQMPFKVHNVPRRPEAPLHVYAHREGIFVTCPGASALGHQAALFAGDAVLPDGGRVGSVGGQDSYATGAMDAETFGGQTNDPREIDKWMKIKEILAGARARARREGREGSELTAEEKRELALLEDNPGGGGGGGSAGRDRPLLGERPAELERYGARLGHLCRLIARDRRPFCPANGILALLPMAATDGDDLAAGVAQCLQEDLAAARDELSVNCPVLTLLCDLEAVPGYAELIARLPKPALSQRMGQRFPFAPEVSPEELPARVESSVRYIGDAFFPNLVSKLWRVEDAPEGEAATTRDNARLFRFLAEVRDRHRRLARLHARALPREGVSMFGGCYVAGTKRDPDAGPAFVRGVFQRLAKEQEEVSWTRAALAEDARRVRIAGAGYIAVVVAVVLALVAGGIAASGMLNAPGDEPAAEEAVG